MASSVTRKPQLESATKAQKKERNRDERKEPTNDLLMNEIVALIPTKASLSLESPNRANALSPATSTHRVLRTRVIPMRQFVSGGDCSTLLPTAASMRLTWCAYVLRDKVNLS